MKKNILFVINPRSGTSKGEHVTSLIEENIDATVFAPEIIRTEYPGHGEKIAAEAVSKNFYAVVSVGGDGSVQEVARATVGTDTLLGIIPKGSGNGLARHLSIPMESDEALKVIHKGNSKTIDVLRINEKLCVNVFGIGFDAHIAKLFSKSSKRGYMTYVKLVLKEFSRFKSLELDVAADEKKIILQSFMLTLANGSQFGNNAMIAPEADIEDGIMEVCSLKKFPFHNAPSLIYLLMKNRITDSRFYSMLRAKEVSISSEKNIVAHLDGEVMEFGKTVHAVVEPKALKIITP